MSQSVQGKSKILHAFVDLEMMCAREPGNRDPDQPQSGHDVSPLPQRKPHLIKNTRAPDQLRVFSRRRRVLSHPRLGGNFETFSRSGRRRDVVARSFALRPHLHYESIVDESNPLIGTHGEQASNYIDIKLISKSRRPTAHDSRIYWRWLSFFLT